METGIQKYRNTEKERAASSFIVRAVSQHYLCYIIIDVLCSRWKESRYSLQTLIQSPSYILTWREIPTAKKYQAVKELDFGKILNSGGRNAQCAFQGSVGQQPAVHSCPEDWSHTEVYSKKFPSDYLKFHMRPLSSKREMSADQREPSRGWIRWSGKGKKQTKYKGRMRKWGFVHPGGEAVLHTSTANRELTEAGDLCTSCRMGIVTVQKEAPRLQFCATFPFQIASLVRWGGQKCLIQAMPFSYQQNVHHKMRGGKKKQTEKHPEHGPQVCDITEWGMNLSLISGHSCAYLSPTVSAWCCQLAEEPWEGFFYLFLTSCSGDLEEGIPMSPQTSLFAI